MKKIANFQKIILWLVMMVVFAAILRAGDGQKRMRDYQFNIGRHRLTCSIPLDFLSDLKTEPSHEAPSLRKGRPGEGASVEYFFHVHMFDGHFGVSNYASLSFSVREIRVDAMYQAPVESLVQLKEFLKWHLRYSHDNQSYFFNIISISGSDWLKMELVQRASDDRLTVRREDEGATFWYPIGDRRFLQISYTIREYIPGKSSRWLADAHAMRDQILDSVQLDAAN